MIINWQKQIVEKNSLKSVKKMIVALRSAAAIDEEYAEGKEFSFAIDNISSNISFFFFFFFLFTIII